MSGEKYPFFDAPEDDVSPLFTTKLQEDALVGCLRGVFEGEGISTSWLKGNEVLESPDFGAELRDLFETLQHDGPLKNLQSMPYAIMRFAKRKGGPASPEYFASLPPEKVRSCFERALEFLQ